MTKNMKKNIKKKQLSTVHFKSLISLKLDNSEAEEDLNKLRETNLRKLNPYVTLITMLMAIINTAYQFFIRSEMIKRNEIWANNCFAISYSVTVISFICFIISIFVKKPSIQMIINCINYVLITPSLFQIRCILVAMNQADNNVYYSIFVLEFFIRTLWLFALLVLYREAIFLDFIIMIGVIVIYPIISETHTIDSYNLPYNLFMFFHVFISYYYTLQVTKIFSYSFNVKKKNKWFSNILENMTSGFVYLKDGCIDYINYSMLEKILRNKEIFNIVQLAEIRRNQRSNNCVSNAPSEIDILFKDFRNGKDIKTEAIIDVLDDVDTSEKIMDILLADIECDIIDNIEVPHILKTTKKFDINKVEEIAKKGFTSKLFFEEFKKKFYDDIINRQGTNKIQGYNSNSEEKQTFVLLGHKELEIDVETDEGVITKESLAFEVHCRFYVNSASKQTENIEFIFKDVTMTKIVEQKNVEFKLKSLVLSKIAHEFKNPLICITELIDQIDDIEEEKLNQRKYKERQNSNSSFKSVINSNLPMIKSLSNYLLILVKNLDFFSQSQSGKANASEMRDTNLKDVIEFCTQISKGLVKKSNKQDDVDVIVEKFSNIPILINSDETKLKQILINLLSNAIKFTHKGFIKLRVSLDEKENLLKFEVNDTGPGMKSDTKANLFKPFKKSNEKNNMNGAGLGLSIVQDLVNQIGGKLDFKSKYGEGTSFWVTLPYSKANTHTVSKYHSNKNFNNEINEEINNEISKENVRRHNSFQEHSNKLCVSIINQSINISNNKSITNSSNDSESIETIKIEGVQIMNSTNRMFDLVPKSKFESENIEQILTTNKINLIVQSFIEEDILSDINSSDQTLLQIKNIVNDNKKVKSMPKEEIKNNKKLGSNFFIKQQFFVNSNVTTNNNIPGVLPHGEVVKEEKVPKINKEPRVTNLKRTSVMSTKFEISDDINYTEDALIFIIADDEPLARQSTIRIIKKAAVKINKHICIIESQDGIETLNLVYKSILNKQRISGIITDETMKFIKGSSFAEIIVKLFEIKIDIPMFLVSAYDDKSVINNVKLFNDVFSKPLNVDSAIQIINFSSNYIA